MKTVQSVLSTLALPFVLGIFTVVITFQQKSDAAAQRNEDRRLSDEQREQDLNISRLLRESDLNQSRLQRDLERTLADEKRHQDYELANETKQLNALQREHEIALELQRHRDAILVSYMNEISILLGENNGSLTRNPLIATLVRLKSLTLIRRLDPLRNSEVIRFLYEAGQLNSSGDHIDLSDAELNGINLSSTVKRKKMHNLYLVGVLLQNSSFVNCDLTEANFSMSILKGANMTETILNNADMSNTILDESSQFIGSRLMKANFRGGQLHGIDFSKSISMYMANFQDTDITQCRFSGLNLEYTDFSKATLKHLDFSSSALTRVKMHDTRVDGINFTDANLNDAHFYYTHLHRGIFENVRSHGYLDFRNVRLSDTTIKNSKFENVRFYGATLENVDFSHDETLNAYYFDSNIDGSKFYNFHSKWVDFKYCTLQGANFSNIHVNYSLSFLSSDLDQVDFGQNHENINFTYCNLTHTNFVTSTLLNPVFIGNNLAFTNMSHANLSNAHFELMNNFSHADLRNTLGITEEILHSALSLDNTYLPNGTRIKDSPELLRNGHGECNVSVQKDWTIKEGNISIQPSIKDPKNCYFIPVNASNDSIPYMSQRVNISRYRTIVINKRAVVLYRARISEGTYISIQELDATGNILQNDALTLASPSKLIISGRIEPQQNTVELQVFIAFVSSPYSNDQEMPQWADFIEVKVDLKIDRTVP